MCACVYFWIILVSQWYPLSIVPVISKLGNIVGRVVEQYLHFLKQNVGKCLRQKCIS